MTERLGWRYYGQQRPPFAEPPGPGQESVWDYPRPPALVPDTRAVIVRLGTIEIASTRRAVRVLETASPPTYYLPPDDVRMDLITPAPGASYCEWKGAARYWSVVTPHARVARAAWSYPDPTSPFASLRDYVSFYPRDLECRVDGELVLPQPGGFYGGWMMAEIVGPVKGGPGSSGW